MQYQKIIKSAIKQALAELEIKPPKEIHLETPTLSDHGDFASNIAMQIADGNPRDLAETIKEKLSNYEEVQKTISKIEIAGPGFLNFWASQEVLLQNLENILNKNILNKNIGKNKKVVIDYSAPNIAKRFSVGHLRSTVIGQAIYNLYTSLGFDTVGDNHLGDWGTQFGMILAGLEKYELDINKLSVEDLENLYVKYSSEAKENPDLREKAKTWFKKLEESDPEATDLWQKAVDVSISEFDKIYQKLGVKLDHAYGESYYQDKMSLVIDEAKSKNLAHESEGALIFKFEAIPPAMLLKSDGTTTYFTRDLAAIYFRMQTWNPNIIIYEVGAEQTLHFRQVFAAAKALGWVEGVELKHVAHGLFLLNGKKMSTRKGTNIKLSELLDKAVEKASEAIDAAQVAKDLDDTEKREISQQVGIGAIKYFDLKHAPNSNIDFNWEDALSMQGNSGPYLQYTNARINSILQRGEFTISNFQFTNNLNINAEEKILLRFFSQYEGIIIDAAKNYSPNTLANYLYDLAQKFNTFYNAHKIIDSENQEFRIALTAATGILLKQGLEILGIETPEKM